MKLGNLDISSFKVGGADCSIYLGNVKLYPSEEPIPTPQWVAYNEGDSFTPKTILCTGARISITDAMELQQRYYDTGEPFDGELNFGNSVGGDGNGNGAILKSFAVIIEGDDSSDGIYSEDGVDEVGDYFVAMFSEPLYLNVSRIGDENDLTEFPFNCELLVISN